MDVCLVFKPLLKKTENLAYKKLYSIMQNSNMAPTINKKVDYRFSLPVCATADMMTYLSPS